MTLPNIITSRLGVQLPRLPSTGVAVPVPPPANSAVDVIGVFDDSLKQLFAKARPMRASVYSAAQVMKHPVESGGTITDHRIIDPTEIELYMSLTSAEYKEVFAQIKEAFGRASLLIVQTNAGSYSNMLISGMPHDETPDNFQAIDMVLRLTEVILVTVQFQALPPKSVATKRNASTIKRGQQTGKAETTAGAGTTPPKSSTAYKLFYGGG